jgi:GTPase SAR1 family protein
MEAIILTGPAGSGKSTLCKSLQDFFLSQSASSFILNLDPANDSPVYKSSIDICDLITLEDVCESLSLGPNGGLIYCMDFILSNINWLDSKLSEHSRDLIIIDCPGQIELFTQHEVLRLILNHIESKHSCKMVVLNLIDSFICASPSNFIAASLVSLSVMTHLELPHLNILSKIDRLQDFYSDLQFSLEFYTDLSQLTMMVSQEERNFNPKMAKISEKLAEVVDDFGLVNFLLVSVSDKQCMKSLVKQIARVLGSHLSYVEEFREFSVSERIADVEERYSGCY